MRVFHVKDFGAVSDGKTDFGDAIRTAIQAAMEAGPGSEVVLGAGEYRVNAGKPKQNCFNIANADGLTVCGQGDETRLVICEDVLFENMIAHASPALVVGLVGKKNTIVVRAVAVRFPEDSNRLNTADADGVHCQRTR